MKKYQILLLIIFFIIGTLLRFTNLNWDSFQGLHPDERNIAWAVTRIHFFGEMNPKFFAYGGLPIYLYRGIGEMVATITNNPEWLSNWGHISVLGRTVSAVLSSISILLIFQVGKLYFGSSTGLLAAFFLTFSPWAIREAHFDTTETMLVFFLLLLARESLFIFHKPTLSHLFKAGLIWGLALGAKTTSLLFAVMPLSAVWLSGDKWHLLKKIKSTVFLTLTALIFFLLTSPFTVLDLGDYLMSMRYETGVALGRFSVPYTLQFINTKPYLYQLTTMIWQAGPVAIIGVLGILILLIDAIGGTGKHFLARLTLELQKRGGTKFSQIASRAKHLMVNQQQPPHNNIKFKYSKTQRAAEQENFCHAERRQRRSILLFFSFPLVYALWAGSWYAKFSRYNVPFLPFATLAAAWLLIFIFKLFSKNRIGSFICLLVYLLIGLFHLWWGFANWSIYLRPQPEVAASRWIAQNIPASATIFTEHWNDGLPLGLPDLSMPNFKRELLTVYDNDNEAKLDYFSTTLPRGDFIILSTRRIWATMPHLTQKYPLTSIFYRKLLNGSLGYRETAVFSSYPGLLGIQVNDDAAEESIQVFDHPTVRIFQNISRYKSNEIRGKLSFR